MPSELALHNISRSNWISEERERKKKKRRAQRRGASKHTFNGMTSVWFGSLLRGWSSSLTFRSRFSTIVCAVLIFHLYEIAFSRARAGRDLFFFFFFGME